MDVRRGRQPREFGWRPLRAFVVGLLLIGATGCSGPHGGRSREGRHTSMGGAGASSGVDSVAAPDVSRSVSDSAARAVLARHRDTLMAVPGVVGTGLGLCDGAYCIKVFVEQRSPVIEERIPRRLEGIAVDVVPTGPIRALGEDTGDAR